MPWVILIFFTKAVNRHTVAELQTLEHAANNSIYNKPYNHAIMHAKEIYKKNKNIGVSIKKNTHGLTSQQI